MNWSFFSAKPGRRATADPLFRCGRWLGSAKVIHAQTDEEIYADGKPLESIDSFCYLENMISVGCGCASAAIPIANTVWGVG